MTQYACQDCTCGAGQGRNCKLREPRGMTKWERRLIGALVLFWFVVLVAMLSGCQRAEVQAQASAVEPPDVFVYRDHDTGCEYVSADLAHSAITPRIAVDGKTHMGCKGGAQ